MFTLFSKKHSYQFLPDTIDVEESKLDQFNPSSTLPPLGNSNMRYRGDKRLIERGGEFHQSTGKLALRKRIRRGNLNRLYSMDLFHSLVDAPTSRIIAILMGGYLSIVVMFAVIYYAISNHYGCNMDLVSFTHALFFSLETMATIGFSTADIFFNDCLITLGVLSVQICVKLTVDAVVIGVLYCKLSRPSTRASTVIFSNHAVIRRIRGKLYFMFQLCELRKHQLVEAHVRVYAVRKEIDLASCFTEDAEEYPTPPPPAPAPPVSETRPPQSAWGWFGFQHSSTVSDEGESMEAVAAARQRANQLPHGQAHVASHASTPMHTPQRTEVNHMHYHVLPELSSFLAQQTQRAARPSYMQTTAMRLNHPNDELGGMLLLMTPQVVVHEIDAGSPLMPPPVWYCNYPTGEYLHFTQSPHLSGLGIQETGDCIRWRPPAYRHFIQHVPVPPPVPPAGWGQDQYPSPSPDRGSLRSSPEGHSLPQRPSMSPTGSSPRVGRSKRHRGSMHRYNSDSFGGAVPQPPQQPATGRTSHRGQGAEQMGRSRDEEEEDVCRVDDVDDLFGEAPAATGSGEGHSGGAAEQEEEQMQSWYYDAEALARIEFPSVNRRIDTDNITLGAPATTASGFGEYSTAAATAGGHHGGLATPPVTGVGVGAEESIGPQLGQSRADVPPPLVVSSNSRSYYQPTGTPVRRPSSHPSTPMVEGAEEGRGGEWVFQSAGMGSYYDLLNPSRISSPHVTSPFPPRQAAASFRYPSPGTANRDRAAATGGVGLGKSFAVNAPNKEKQSQEQYLDQSPPPEQGLTVQQSVPFQSFSQPGSVCESSSLSSSSVSPARRSGAEDASSISNPSTSPLSPVSPSQPPPPGMKISPSKSMSRIPVLVRTPSKATNVVLGEPPHPPGVSAPAGTGADRAEGPTQSHGDALAASTLSPKASGVFSNPLRPPPSAPASGPESGPTDASASNAPGEEGSQQEPPKSERPSLPPRAKSKRDQYVSPYKQALRPASSTAALLVTSDTSPSSDRSPTKQGSRVQISIPSPSPTISPSSELGYGQGAAEPAFGGTSIQRAPVPQYGSTGTSQVFRSVPSAPSNGNIAQLPPSQLPAASQQRGAASAVERNRTAEVGWSSYAGHGGRGHPQGSSASTSHASPAAVQPVYDSWQSEERSMVQRYLRDRQVEIIVVVEGVDAATGGMVQARHSYTSDEIEWDRSFQCCVFKDPEDGFTTIDYNLFHKTLSVPPDAPFAGVVHSSI